MRRPLSDSESDVESDTDSDASEVTDSDVSEVTASRVLYAGRPRSVEFGGPENSIMTFLKSDGDRNLLPVDEEEVVDENGDVDFMREATAETKQDWYKKVATYVVHDGNWHKKSRKHFYFSSSGFPKGYKLYMHYKGKKENPRTDAYLYGSTEVQKFRSPKEFAPHATWLIFGCPRDDEGRPRCGCRYCSGVKQGIISERLRRVTAHLRPDPVEERRRSTGGRSTSVVSPTDRRRRSADVTRIVAKDYTHINEDPGGPVPRWKETPLPPGYT